MNATQKKNQKTSRVIAVITKILAVTSIVFLCFEIIGLIWYMVSPDATYFMLGSIQIITPFEISRQIGIIPEMFASVASQCFFTAIIIITSKIFKDISRESYPFLKQNIKRMKKIAILLLLNSIVSPSIQQAIGKSLNLSSQMEPFNYNLELFILAIVIFCFAMIFEYGTDLQQLSDKTF